MFINVLLNLCNSVGFDIYIICFSDKEIGTDSTRHKSKNRTLSSNLIVWLQRLFTML